MQPEDFIHDFYCPHCHSNHFKRVGVHSSKTGRFVIVDGLYHCSGCSVVFTDPHAFTQLVQDSIVDRPHYRERRATREYPPDALTLRRRKKDPQ
jgi:hypothetical protein